jgi:hypothetical protein
MNIAELFDKLIVRPNIEIVIPLLPEMRGLSNQPPRYALFERLDRIRERSAARFAQQQMHMVGHDHVCVDTKIEAAPDPLKSSLENTLRRRIAKIVPPMPAGERDKVRLSGGVKALQPCRHGESVLLLMSPTHAKPGLEWATRQAWLQKVGFASNQSAISRLFIKRLTILATCEKNHNLRSVRTSVISPYIQYQRRPRTLASHHERCEVGS